MNEEESQATAKAIANADPTRSFNQRRVIESAMLESVNEVARQVERQDPSRQSKDLSPMASLQKRPGSAAKPKGPGKIQAQRLKEREKEYNVKKTALDLRLAEVSKEAQKAVLLKQAKELDAEYWDVLENK